jgi:uncharacterized cupin superfamily protein
MSKRINCSKVPEVVGTKYPFPYDEPCRKRVRKRIGDAAGLFSVGSQSPQVAAKHLVQPATLAQQV